MRLSRIKVQMALNDFGTSLLVWYLIKIEVQYVANCISKHFYFYNVIETGLVSIAGTNAITNPMALVQIPCWLFFAENRRDQSSKLVLSRDQTSKLETRLQ